MKSNVVRTALAVVALLSSAACARDSTSSSSFLTVPQLRGGTPPSPSVSKAYDFLRKMMDKYARGSTLRLVQSFDGGPLAGFTDAVTYDDALFIDAMLTNDSVGDTARSAVVGRALMYLQQHDKSGDGRLRAAYAPKPLKNPQDIVVRDNTSDVGNMAWVGQALVQLYAKTSQPAYLNSAIGIAQWLQINTYDTRGAGGYTGGYTAQGVKIKWKSTEHNIDIYAFFTMLAAQSGQSIWASRAAWATQFVVSMWDSRSERFYVGTLNDGKAPNTSFRAEDVNSWSYLAFARSTWAAAPSWDVQNLAVSRGGFSGVSFCSGDRSGVWFEGTAHLADALQLRNAPGDGAQALRYRNDIEYAQTHAPNADGRGIVAASKNGLSDCDGSKYYASLHVGATAWYIMAELATNPFEELPIRRQL